MNNRKIKKLVCGLAVSLCLVGNTMPVFAQTVDFDVTVPGDILSKRALKADSEQYFYVTGTSFSSTIGELECISINRANSDIQSLPTKISQKKKSSKALYRRQAPANQYYYMTTDSDATGLHVIGRYTP